MPTPLEMVSMRTAVAVVVESRFATGACCNGTSCSIGPPDGGCTLPAPSRLDGCSGTSCSIGPPDGGCTLPASSRLDGCNGMSCSIGALVLSGRAEIYNCCLV